MNVTMNTEQRLYVIPCGDGYSCLSFDNARDHANQIASKLDQPALAFGPEDHGTLAGHAKYRAAIDAWSRSPLAHKTYFDPGTEPDAARVLEMCRRGGQKVRLMLGDTTTGKPWLLEHDIVGRIGRSTGTLKVPLLIESGAGGGVAILTNSLLGIIDWETGQNLYRHPAFQAPELSIVRAADKDELPWRVLHDGTVAACFSDIGKAGGYIAFMCGETIEPRVFQ